MEQDLGGGRQSGKKPAVTGIDGRRSPVCPSTGLVEAVWLATCSRLHVGFNPLATSAFLSTGFRKASEPPAATPHSTTAHCSGPVEQAEKRFRPTDTFGYRWLGVGVALGSTAACGLAAAPTIVAGTYLVYAGLTVHLASACVLSALISAHVFGFRSGKVSKSVPQKDPHNPPAQPRNGEVRLRSALEELSTRLGLGIPRIYPMTSGLMSIREAAGGGHVLWYNPAVINKLSDRELRFVVAHELSHRNQGVNWIERTLRCARCTSLIFSVTALYPCMTNPGNSYPAVLLTLLATGTALTLDTVIDVSKNLLIRANEIRTDIRALEVTQDLQASEKAIAKMYDLGLEGTPAWLRPLASFLQPITTHPSAQMRVRWLRSAWENATKAAQS